MPPLQLPSKLTQVFPGAPGGPQGVRKPEIMIFHDQLVTATMELSNFYLAKGMGARRLDLTQGLHGPYFLGPAGDLPGSILGPFQDLRATFGHLLVTPAWPIKAFPVTSRGLFRSSGAGPPPKC